MGYICSSPLGWGANCFRLVQFELFWCDVAYVLERKCVKVAYVLEKVIVRVGGADGLSFVGIYKLIKTSIWYNKRLFFALSNN